MRKLKLRFVIPKEDESNVTGKFFKVFCECMKPVDNIDINGGKLNIIFSFEEIPTKIIQAISELPFQNVEYLGLEDVAGEDKSSEEAEETNSHRNVDPNQITIDSLLGEKQAEAEDASKGFKTPSEEKNAIQEEETSEAVATSEAEQNQSTEETSPKSTSNKRGHSRKSEEIDEVGAKVFKDEAEKASSFEEFVDNMGKIILLTNTHKDFFLAMARGACAVEEFSVPAISKYMEEQGNSITTTNRVAVSQKVKAAFEKIGSNVRFASFFKEISKYKNYNFGGSEAEAPSAEEDNGETNKERFFRDEPFKVLKKELVEKVNSLKDTDFSGKVGIILDEVRAENDIQFYNENREKFIQLVVQTAEKVTSGANLLTSFNEYATSYFGNISHMAKAYLYQSIKNYCGSTETIEEGKIAGFFDDVIRLM